MLGFVEIPQHGGTILSTGSTERTIWRNGDGVDVSRVTNVVGLKLAVGKFPDLIELVMD
jgi:hypothetical protein